MKETKEIIDGGLSEHLRVQEIPSRINAPLGIRQNNPLNIRKSSSKWLGAVQSPNSFVKFSSMFWGWRAALIIMTKTYYSRGWTTPFAIISHWAPFTENDTNSYVSFVCSYCELNKDKPMPPFSFIYIDDWRRFLIAMAKMECGIAWIDEKVIKHLDNALEYMLKH